MNHQSTVKKYQYSPNYKRNNNIYNDSYKNNNKNTENNNISDIPKSQEIIPGTNDKIPPNLKNNSEQCGSITVPFTNNHLLSPFYSKLSSSIKKKHKSDTTINVA